MSHNLYNSMQEFKLKSGSGKFYSLQALEAAGIGKVSRLPVSIRIVLESVLRNCDGKKVTEEHVRQVANWSPKGRARRKFPSSSRASCCRILPACRCWPTWRQCATSPAIWAGIPRSSSRWCRWTWWWTTR